MGLDKSISKKSFERSNSSIFVVYTGISIYDGQEIKNINQHDGLPQKPINGIFPGIAFFMFVTA